MHHYGPPHPPYTPPPPPPPHRQLPATIPLPAMLVVAFVCLFAGCAGGAAIASGPSADTPTAEPRPAKTVVRTVTATPSPTLSAAATARPAGSVRMPDLVGKNGAIAEDTLKRAGITNIRFASADPDASVVLLPENWKITKQDPKPGKKVRDGQLVVLTAVKAG